MFLSLFHDILPFSGGLELALSCFHCPSHEGEHVYTGHAFVSPNCSRKVPLLIENSSQFYTSHRDTQINVSVSYALSVLGDSTMGYPNCLCLLSHGLRKHDHKFIFSLRMSFFPCLCCVFLGNIMVFAIKTLPHH